MRLPKQEILFVVCILWMFCTCTYYVLYVYICTHRVLSNLLRPKWVFEFQSDVHEGRDSEHLAKRINLNPFSRWMRNPWLVTFLWRGLCVQTSVGITGILFTYFKNTLFVWYSSVLWWIIDHLAGLNILFCEYRSTIKKSTETFRH